jgi:hypothetical protein
VASWLQADATGIERRLVGTRSPLAEWCEPRQVRRLFGLVARGAPGADHHLYKLLATQLWHERCIDSASAPT